MTCPLCSTGSAHVTASPSGGRKSLINCGRCGIFTATIEFIRGRPDDLTDSQIGNISGWVREHPNTEFFEEDWVKLRAIKNLSIGEKAERLLIHLANRNPIPNRAIQLLPEEEFISTCWATGQNELGFIFHQYLTSYKKFIYITGTGTSQISPEGWDYLHSLKQVNKDSQIGFCAMWFSSEVEKLWSDGIAPAITGAGYDAKRIDKHQHNNKIDDEIIAMIRRSKFVVADFTGHRGGVYFEAGFSLGLGISVIWTIREDDLHNTHFDNRQYNFLLWNDGKIGEFKSQLQSRIEATLGRGLNS